MSVPSLSLAGKVAIVTGSRRGIGRAIALVFAEAGADVAICDKVTETGELKAVADEIQRLGRHALAVKTDVTCQLDVDNLVQRAMDELGGIDILVNNAGVWEEGWMLEANVNHWDWIMDTDVKGYYLCSQAAGRRMAERKKGNIINIASVSSFKASSEGGGAYCVAKAGVVMLTKTLAKELASYSIRVNAISPGTVRTEMTRFEWSDPEYMKNLVPSIPIGRIAEPNEIANVALFLASEASSYMTGSTVLVDGGYTA